jgi:hypothetical protein
VKAPVRKQRQIRYIDPSGRQYTLTGLFEPDDELLEGLEQVEQRAI